ncbi:MAG: DNA polymerase II [Candidatus Rokuibacteriota bacterium]|nr:MAG: DNA polymerase II [Candidatus Rokubacteria bacterium]PYO08547.1 MAG: DNA polymerase II [Candidatus Rokubacteria bacterium]
MLTIEHASLLFGRDPSPGLVAFDLAEGGRAIRLYRRSGAGTLTETAPFSPFLLLADPDLVKGAPGLLEVDALEGPGALRWRARFGSWADALGARDRCRDQSGQLWNVPGAPYLFLADSVHQYLLQAGRTSFGGLVFTDLRRLALDIEVMTTEGHEFPSAARPGDRIIAVALADTTGFRHVVRGDRLDERSLLEECSRIIRERDPDVIEGHNIFRFDLEYLEARARLHRVVLTWGRGGESLRSRVTRLQIAERTIGYRRYEVAGRHVIDTWILAQLHDAGTRDLPGFGLKDLARHFGVAAADRTYIDASQITREFSETPERLMAYAGDDAVETLAIASILAPPYFAQAQTVPFDYQSCTLRGAAAKIDALVLREYLARGQAVPLPGPVGPVGGGYTAICQEGVARPVLHVDVTSLYPSLMLAKAIAPASDTLGVFPELLQHLRDFRVRAKRLAREAREPAERAHLGALQQSFKILINAFYGYLAFSGGHWNDFDAADRVTAEGRAVVTAILAALEKLGAVPVEADTDGVYFVPPPGHSTADDEILLERLTEGLPSGIQLELDGRYAAMFSYKMKTYALLDERGRLSLKGSAFRSRGLEPFQRQIIGEIVRCLVHGRRTETRAVIDRWLGDFAAHRVELRAFARTETLQESIEAYREKIRIGARSASAAYELAGASGRAVQPGDQISYYVAGRGPNVTVNEYAKLASLWDAARPDENVEYYQAKVLEIWDRFRAFADLEGLRPPAAETESSAQLSLF